MFLTKITIRSLVVSAVALQSLVAQAVFTQSEKLADFRQLVTTIEQSYGPLRWKQRSVGLDWATHVETYRDLVRRTSSDEEFYQVLTKFLAGLKDAHVSVNVPSTLSGNLGFLCDYLDGKVLIDAVNRRALPAEVFPFNRGDQLLAIGGRPVDALLNEISALSDTGYELSTKRLAAAFLTFRRQSRGMPVPRGITNVTILPKGAARPVTVAVAWAVSGQPILDVAEHAPVILDTSLRSVSQEFKTAVERSGLFRLALTQDRRRELAQAGISDIGNPASMFELPSDAVPLPMIPFTAVRFTRNEKRIGILRLPEYGDENFAAMVAMALQMLEPEVDVLVIDQANNPGGYVSTVSLIMSFFVDQSTKDAMFAVRPSRSWLNRFAELNALIEQMLVADPNDLVANAFKPRFNYLEQLFRSSLEERRFLTEPFSLDMTGALGVINPHPTVRFTKPVLMLINEFDFSGGDVFPALMQDSGRAKLFGNRTTGAGGNVSEFGPLTVSGTKFNLTESLIIRPNGGYIENLGVTPDVQYSITEKDFNDGYKDYTRAFLCEALKLVDGACTGDLFVPAAPAPAGGPR
jgi:C-terminal processing protease CtpA/Prc